MQFGVNIVPVHPERLAEVAVRAEELGFESLWTGEHVVTPTALRYRYPGRTGEPPFAWNSRFLDPLAPRDHRVCQDRRVSPESRVRREQRVKLVLLVSLGWLALSALVAVTVGKAIAAYQEQQERRDLQARRARESASRAQREHRAKPDLRVVPAPRAIRDRPDRQAQ